MKPQILKYIIVLFLAIFFATELGGIALAQRTTSTSSARGFVLTGDVRVEEAQASEPGPSVLDVILYTTGNQVFARQRITPNGRYKFLDVFTGEYYVVIEYENQEVARATVFISATSPTELKQDFTLAQRSNGGRSGAGVVSAAD